MTTDERLLLVDDEPGIRQILTLSLSDLGYTVAAAENGHQALQRLESFAPSIVLTDIKMPGMDGIELLSRIKERAPDEEVVMLSGHGDLDLAIQSLQGGAVDFVTKPVKDDILQIALGRAKERLANRRERRQHMEDLERLVEEKTSRVLELERQMAVGETVQSLTAVMSEMAQDVAKTEDDPDGGPAFFNDLPCYVAVHNRYLEIVAVNEMYCQRLGDLTGKPSWEAYIGREDESNACPVYMALKTGKGQKSQETLRAADGSEIPVVVHTAPIPGKDGTPDMVLEFSVDTTEVRKLQDELKSARQKYQDIFDASPAFISVHDAHFNIVETNRLFQEAFGDALGKPCYQVYKHRQRPCSQCLVHKTIKDGQSHELETVVTSQQGRQYTVLIRTSPIYNDSGKIVQVMEMATDITQLRKLQDHLTSLGLMLGSMSHGIKGLLTALDGGVYKVDSGLARGDMVKVQTGWEAVTSKLDRIKKMVLDILYYAKSRALTRQSLEVGAFAKDLEMIVRPKAENAGVDFNLTVQPGAGAFEVDETALASALVNILENGVEACASDTSKPSHTVDFTVSGDAGTIRFAMADNGMGMDAETREKLFTLFYSSKGSQGTGLGMFIANQVVEEHGGQISVQSEPGTGTAITVSVPRFAPAEEKTPDTDCETQDLGAGA